MLITIGKRIVYTIIICIALLFIALGSMWCLSSHYKLYGVPVLIIIKLMISIILH